MAICWMPNTSNGRFEDEALLASERDAYRPTRLLAKGAHREKRRRWEAEAFIVAGVVRRCCWDRLCSGGWLMRKVEEGFWFGVRISRSHYTTVRLRLSKTDQAGSSA
jgi:hypothetical protein